MVLHWNEEEFEKGIDEYPVLAVDFWADWCMPCRMMAPHMDKLAEEYEGRLTVAKVNVDEARDLAVSFGIQSIPTVLFFKNGEVAEELVGLTSYDDLKQVADRCL